MSTEHVSVSRELVSRLQSLRDRWIAIAEDHSFGDQLDGDFDTLLEAINAIRRLSRATPRAEMQYRIHTKCARMWSHAKVAGQCDRPTVEWHGWVCGQGHQHEGPCIPSPSEIARIFDNDCVDEFAQAMKEKLAAARSKGRGGWNDKDDCTQQRLSKMLRDHVEKGDPRDVANFCMFLYMRDEAILSRATPGDTHPQNIYVRLAQYGAEYAYRNRESSIEELQDGCEKHIDSWIAQASGYEPSQKKTSAHRVVADELDIAYVDAACGGPMSGPAWNRIKATLTAAPQAGES